MRRYSIPLLAFGFQAVALAWLPGGAAAQALANESLVRRSTDAIARTSVPEMRPATAQGVDLNLLRRLVAEEVNNSRRRSRARLGSVSLASDLERPASVQAKDMAAVGTISHDTPRTTPRETFQQRLRRYGVDGARIGEACLQMTMLRPVPVTDAFEGRYYAAHTEPQWFTHRQLAEEIVTELMTSAPHRRILTDPGMEYIGVGLAVGRVGNELPQVYVCLDFAGARTVNPYSKR